MPDYNNYFDPEYQDQMMDQGFYQPDQSGQWETSGTPGDPNVGSGEANTITVQDYQVPVEQVSWLKRAGNDVEKTHDAGPPKPADLGYGKMDPAKEAAQATYKGWQDRMAQHRAEREKMRKDWITPALMLFAAARPMRWRGVSQALQFMQNQKSQGLAQEGSELEREGRDIAAQQHWSNMEAAARNRGPAAQRPIVGDNGGYFIPDPSDPTMGKPFTTEQFTGPYEDPGEAVQQKQLFAPRSAAEMADARAAEKAAADEARADNTAATYVTDEKGNVTGISRTMKPVGTLKGVGKPQRQPKAPAAASKDPQLDAAFKDGVKRVLDRAEPDDTGAFPQEVYDAAQIAGERSMEALANARKARTNPQDKGSSDLTPTPTDKNRLRFDPKTGKISK